MHGRQLGLAAVAMAVFEGEGARVERQRVELQRAGVAVGVEVRAGLLAASAGAFPRLRAGVQVFAAPLRLGRLQQLNGRKTKDGRGVKTGALKGKTRKSNQRLSGGHLLRRDGRGSSGYGLQHRP